jgi:hypothetical protein
LCGPEEDRPGLPGTGGEVSPIGDNPRAPIERPVPTPPRPRKVATMTRRPARTLDEWASFADRFRRLSVPV